jgi:dihydrofolate reductase
MKTRAWIAASADGFVADAAGGVGWLDRWDPHAFGYEAFFAGIGAVVLGRATYETALAFGPWPYAARKAYVLTGRALPAAPHLALASPDPAALHAAAARETASGDLWHVGGGRAIAAFLDAGLIDEIEVFQMPLLLGNGIRLFPGSAARETELALVDSEVFAASGAVRLRYALRRGTTRSASST